MQKALKRRVLDGDPINIGLASITMSEAELGAHLRGSRYDLVFADLQHTPHTESQIVTFCSAASKLGVLPLLRIQSPTLTCLISRILDFGAGGVVIPMAEDTSSVMEAVRSFYYPPKGNRSWWPQYGHRYDASIAVREYADWWNDNGLLAVQIETVKGVMNARDMVLAGAHVALFGATDLTFSIEATPDGPFRSVAECQRHVVEKTRGLDVRICVGDAPHGQF